VEGEGWGREKEGTLARKPLGSISAAFSSLVYVPPEQRLVIEPSKPLDFEKRPLPGGGGGHSLIWAIRGRAAG